MHNQGIRYIFFGGCTTMVNLVSYWIFRNLIHIDVTRANFFAIALSILFAYVVNKQFVFESKTTGYLALLKEMGQFIGMRLLTMFIEIFGVVMFCCVWNMQDMIAKLIIQVVVLILNFVFSKLIVFRTVDAVFTREELQKKKVRKWCAGLGFAIPALTVLIAYIVNGVYPFGDHGVLIIDSLHQYLPFFTDFHDKLVNSQSLTWSFGGGLGYNMWAVFAYYLASPLNLLITAVSSEHVMDFMAYLILLKIALTGGIFGWYLSQREGDQDYFPVAFACMYALSAFMIGYYFNVMWLDSIMVLPLVMLGIEKIVAGEKGSMYALALLYGLYCNYYIGYMLCLFACLYFLILWIGAKKFEVKKFLGTGVKFTWFSLLAGGMAALVLLPAYLNLGITESADSSFPDKIKFYTDGIAQMTGHFALVEPINIYDDQSGVNIYCGVIVLILVVLYLLDQELRLSERVAKLLLLGLLALSMNFNMLNYIWHGFHVQNGLPNRFAFLYIALLLTMGFDAIRHIRKMKAWKIMLSWLAAILFTAYCMVAQEGEREWYVYMVTLLLLVLYGILLLWYHESERRTHLAKCVLTSVLAAEMAVTGIYGICMNGTVGRSTYVDEQIAYKKLVGEYDQTDDFYRSEIDSQRMRNENMFMGANGVVLFSSTMPEATVNLCRSIGMEARTNKDGYNGMTKLFNDVFGVRYLVSRKGSDTLYQMTQEGYEEPLYLYKNNQALSLGFMVSSEIRNWNIYSNQTAMEIQAQFAQLATGVPFAYTLREAYSLEEGPTYIIRLHPGEQTYIEFTENVKSVTIKTPQSEKTVNNYTKNLFNLGTVTEEGENSKANITITYKDNQSSPVPVRVYTCSDEEYQEVYQKLAANQMEHVVEEGNHVSGEIQVDQAGTLLLTIPYDEGWNVKVDGENVSTYRVGDALTGVDLTEGSHQIEMNFTPSGLDMGSLISIVCIALFLFSAMLEQYSQKKKEQKKQEETEGETENEAYIFG